MAALIWNMLTMHPPPHTLIHKTRSLGNDPSACLAQGHVEVRVRITDPELPHCKLFLRSHTEGPLINGQVLI